MSIISLFPARICKGVGRGGAMKEEERVLTWLALGSLSGIGEMVKLVLRSYSRNFGGSLTRSLVSVKTEMMLCQQLTPHNHWPKTTKLSFCSLTVCLKSR